MTRVVNIHKEPYDVYIGRKGKGHDGYFGNPFPLVDGEPRGSTLEKYKKYFLERIATDPTFKDRILGLKGKTLGCFCSPLPCHGDVIVEWLNNPAMGHKGKIVAVTGHRPGKIYGYDRETTAKLLKLATFSLKRLEPKLVITGMALGWDQAIANACRQLEIPYHAYIPFIGQEAIWNEESKAIYTGLLASATKVVNASGQVGFNVKHMHDRNHMMVDACELLLGFYSGAPGGTQACWNYAISRGKPKANAWQRWVDGNYAV